MAARFIRWWALSIPPEDAPTPGKVLVVKSRRGDKTKVRLLFSHTRFQWGMPITGWIFDTIDEPEAPSEEPREEPSAGVTPAP